jgi:hypothetical protein
MTVGGGFAGAMVTLPVLNSSYPLSAKMIAGAFVLANVYVVAAGLILVQNSRITSPLMLALAIQIPVFSSPILSYTYALGLYLVTGLTGTRLFFTYGFGARWQFFILREAPWTIGINIVPVILLIAVKLSHGKQAADPLLLHQP